MSQLSEQVSYILKVYKACLGFSYKYYNTVQKPQDNWTLFGRSRHSLSCGDTCSCSCARAANSAFDGLPLLFGCVCGPNGLILGLPLAGVCNCACGSPVSALMLLVLTPSCCWIPLNLLVCGVLLIVTAGLLGELEKPPLKTSCRIGDKWFGSSP